MKNEFDYSEEESEGDGGDDGSLKIIDAAIEKLKDGDDGAHWEPEVIAAAKTLFDDDRALYQRKRGEIKNANKNVQITEWTKEVKGGGEQLDSNKADELVDLVRGSAELFHNEKNECFVTIDQSRHTETWPIGSLGFIDWIGFKAYSELGFSPSETTVKQAIATLNGIAKYEGAEREVFIRCAKIDGGYMIDLCNDEWQAVKVTAQGWQIINNPEVRFIRSGTATALPTPTKDNLDLLWKYVNVKESERLLMLAYMLESWRPETPFVLLLLVGEQGSGKSSTHRATRQLSDPNSIPLRSAPKTVQDIFVSAGANWQASFENMSNLSAAMQDALCTICTGGGFAARKLYTDGEESVIEVKRPVIINGISRVVNRPDLIDRTIALDIPRIADKDRKKESEIAKEFEEDSPAIFAGLLGLFAKTLKELPNINIEKPPRMADFTYLGEAICKALSINEIFFALYKENRKDSLAHSLDSSPAALAIQEMMKDREPTPWTGTLKELKIILDDRYHQDGEGWPKSPKGLSEVLRRMAPALKEHGVELEFSSRKRDGYHVNIFFQAFSVIEKPCSQRSQVHKPTNTKASSGEHCVNVKNPQVHHQTTSSPNVHAANPREARHGELVNFVNVKTRFKKNSEKNINDDIGEF
jgi:shikimate kinase